MNEDFKGELWKKIIQKKIENQAKCLTLLGIEGTVAKFYFQQFHPAIGIHHEGPFNGFNLVDDLIEPWRAMVDVVVHEIVSSQINLSREQRRTLGLILHNVCFINEEKNTISNGINIMIQTFKQAVESQNIELLKLPDILQN